MSKGPHYLNSSEAERLIRLIVNEGTVKISAHCRQRMRWRRVNVHDLVHLLLTGEVKRLAEWDSDNCNWKYRVEGIDINGNELTAITVIIESDMLLVVITTF
jgi:hypothetical protein